MGLDTRTSETSGALDMIIKRVAAAGSRVLQRRGIGSRLLRLAQTRRPQGLGLWTFQANLPGRRFYERHGFMPVAWTDGTANEEHEPDVRYTWVGR